MSTGPKRFYERAEAIPHEDGFAVALDGRVARSPGRHSLSAPKALAEAMAAEWEAQGETLDMRAMPLTALQGRLLDASDAMAAEWTETVASYAGTDLLCYRGDDPALATRQAAVWQPILDRVGAALGLSFTVAEGVIAADQPPELAKAVRADLAARPLAARYAAALITEITGSGVIALDHLMGGDADALFAASRLDERFQEERWGQDAEAKAREAALARDFAAVVRFLSLSLADDQRT